MIEAKEILASENPSGDRLMTMWCRYPKFVHGEHLRHRSFSFSVSSSRAIPVSKNLEEVRSDELRAAPVWWGREQKGMSSGEELSDVFGDDPLMGHEGAVSDRDWAKWQWKLAALQAVKKAELLRDLGAHKSITNRLLEPFLHVNVLVSGTTTGWMNFFGLRLDKAAQPEIRVLAEAQWRVWNESKPQKLQPGQWHLPFVDEMSIDICNEGKLIPEVGPGFIYPLIKISVARCARLSYQSFESGKRSTIGEDLVLYKRLVGSSPIHASPAEHQATPDEVTSWDESASITKWGESWKTFESRITWKHFEQAGNLGLGWRQYRKMLPGEAIAPLPSEYK